MRIADFTLKLLGLTESMRRWQGVLADIDDRRRDRIARYAEEIAGTLGRAAEGLDRLLKDPADRAAARITIRELGRLGGYIEGIVATLAGHLDGRRIAGLQRRLEGLAGKDVIHEAIRQADQGRVDRLAEAEGYFRALADALRLTPGT